MTPSINIVALYAALFAFFHFAITIRVGLIRNRTRTSFGDGGDSNFLKLIRGQQNFAENVPIALILSLLVAMKGAGVIWMHLILVLLLVGRVSHYLQLTGVLKPLLFRAGGMVLTFSSILVSAVWLLLHLA